MQWPIRKQQTMTTMTTTRAANVQGTIQNRSPGWRICKWSGSDEPQSCYHDDDEDTGTLTVEEQRRIQWYRASARVEWHNADEDEDEERGKSNISDFGLCCSCKKKLNDRADFVCNPQKSFYRMCTKCHEDYSKPWYLAAEQQPNQ